MKPIPLHAALALATLLPGLAAAGTTYELQPLLHTGPSGPVYTMPARDQVIQVRTDAAGNTTRKAFYPHLPDTTSPYDPDWTQSWTATGFIEHEEDENILCASGIQVAWQIVHYAGDANTEPYDYAVYTNSAYLFECTWDGGQSWRSVEHLKGVPEYFAPQPTVRAEDAITARILNRLESAPDASGDLLLTSYDRVFRIRPNTVGNNASLTLDHSLPLPAACTPASAQHGCASLILNNYAPVWWDPAQPGQGLTLIPVAGKVWGYHTAYGADGQADWALINHHGTYLGAPATIASNLTTSLFHYSGPPPGAPWSSAGISVVEEYPVIDIAAGRFPLGIQAFGPRLLVAYRAGFPPLLLKPFE